MEGFYIGRYEATTPDGTENTKTNITRVPTCQSGKTIWTNISQINSKASAESMYTGDTSSVQSGLLTGKVWDRTCHWISDYKITVNNIEEIISITDSRKYGNYLNSDTPANIGIYQSNLKQLSGANENLKIKNIYDLAGNVWEWTYEISNSICMIRGGCFDCNGDTYPVSCCFYDYSNSCRNYIGFRIRLYIKTS